MDAGRGVICRGPEGPNPDFIHLGWWRMMMCGWSVSLEEVPSTADLLQEDVFLRFLASRKSKEVDRSVVEAIPIPRRYVTREDASERCDQPTVFSTLTQTPIAVANNIWEDIYETLSEGTVLENGLTR